MASRLTRIFISFFNLVGSSFTDSRAFPILPISVLIPVATIFTMPFPCTIIEPEYTNGLSSPPGLLFKSPSLPSAFRTGTDSPVSKDSSAIRFTHDKTMASAGTLSPSCNMTRSSVTTSRPGILFSIPFLITNALGLARSFSASSAFSVFFSW